MSDAHLLAHIQECGRKMLFFNGLIDRCDDLEEIQKLREERRRWLQEQERALREKHSRIRLVRAEEAEKGLA